MHDALTDSLNLDPMRYAMEGFLAHANLLIQWPSAKYWDKPWNIRVGCSPCSPACENCYAAAWAKRFGQSFKPHFSRDKNPPRKGVVFCGNVTDLFLESPEWTTEDMVDCIGRCYGNQHRATYLWCTKRVDRLCEVLSTGSHQMTYRLCDGETDTDHIPFSKLDLSNHYFGFTAENQEWFAKRGMEVLKNFPKWAKLWVSMEPLLGPIGAILGLDPKPSWIVVGAESGKNRRPCKIEWVESIVEECRAADVPVFVKQICLPSGKFTNKIEEFPAHLQIRQVPWAVSSVP